MFDGLRKKFANVIKGFVKSEEAKAEQPADNVQEQVQKTIQPSQGRQGERPKINTTTIAEHEQPANKLKETHPGPEPKSTPEQHVPEHKPAPTVETRIPASHQESAHQPRGQKAAAEKPPKNDLNEPLIRLGIGTKIKRAIFSTVVLSAPEISDLTDKLKISMLESDVSYDVAEEFVNGLTPRLAGKKIESKMINRAVTESIRSSLSDSLAKSKADFDVFDLISRKRPSGEPFVILFLGPNGTGKTTTIAKLASRMKSSGTTCVLAASDTFRAAAIEQIEHHANKIGVPVIKGKYGSDPASIAFDATAYARAHRISVVLVDSAGRQETNANLIREVEKMARVSKPDLTIYVGESTSGNAITGQIREFRKHVRVDGVILTKLDCDAKGGNALSISHETGIPILFFGTGESYDALVPYDPSIIIDAILPVAS
jgi:fused signal recognition particle receptor